MQAAVGFIEECLDFHRGHQDHDPQAWGETLFKGLLVQSGRIGFVSCGYNVMPGLMCFALTGEAVLKGPLAKR